MTHVPEPGTSQPGEASIIPSPKWAVCLWGGRHQPAKPTRAGSRVGGAQGFEGGGRQSDAADGGIRQSQDLKAGLSVGGVLCRTPCSSER